MKKTQIILIMLLITALLAGCNAKEKLTGQVMFENTHTIDPRNPGQYGTSLNSVTKNDNPIKCKSGSYSWEAAITNVYDSADYGLMLFVNGILTPFSTDFEKHELEMHTVTLGVSDELRFTVNVKAENVPSDGKIYASLVTILNPRHVLKTTDYINYLPHHSLASFAFYTLEKSDKSSLESPGISNADIPIKLSDSLNSDYETQIKDQNGKVKTINSLDTTNDFLLSDKDEFSKIQSMYAVAEGNDLKLKLGCLGKNEKFRISLYINNNIVPAFDGNYYCDVETQRNLIMTKDISIPSGYLSSLDEFNHIYLIAVPLSPSFDEEKYDRPIKTITKMLYISSEENVKSLAEKLSVVDDTEYASESESTENISETEKVTATQVLTTDISSQPASETNTTVATTAETSTVPETHSTENVKTTKPQETTKKEEPKATITHTTQEVTVPSVSAQESSVNVPVWDLWVADESTALIKSMTNGNLYLYDIKSGKIGKSVQGGEKVQKLDNGFAVLTLHNSGYTVYDKKLNKITSGKLPYSTEKDELVYAVSQDGKSIAYCINENGKGSVYIDSVSQSGRKKIASFASASKVGAVTWLEEITAFKGNNIIFSGSYIERFDSRGNAVGQTCYGCITTAGNISKQTSNGYNRLCYKGSNMVVADNSPLSAGSTDGTIEYWNVSSGSRKSFSFSNGNESRYAVISENGKYIASEEIHSDCSGITIRIYDAASKKVVFKEKYRYSGLEAYPIDFCESGKFAVLAIDSSIKKIPLG